jgi:hypothetical protein
MKDWRTTLLGMLGAIAIGIEPVISTGHVNWRQIGLAAFIALMSYLAADARKGSTNDNSKKDVSQ